MSKEYDLIIIGAGPAGMAAAVEADACGLSVALIDEAAEPGGQIYRAIETTSAQHKALRDLLGEDYAAGAALATAFRQTGSDYLPGMAVWRVDTDGQVACSDGNAVRALKGCHVLVATGAYERPVALPGWTLPGVMTAGAAQTLLKSGGCIPDGPIVVAGSGPLLLLIAAQLIAAGGEVAAVVETTKISNYLQALPALPQALKAREYLLKGIKMRRAIKRAGVPIISGASDLEVRGEDHARALACKVGGQVKEIPAPTILLHQGVVPNVQVTRQLECEHRWDELGHYWRPVIDDWGVTSANAIYVAGDSSGIVGAEASRVSGHLAVLDIAYHQGLLTRDQRDEKARAGRQKRAHHLAIRPFLENLFPPPEEILKPPSDSTVVCRCEEVTAGEIREAVALGGRGPNQLKAYTRCGMGPCQGRMCGLTVGELIAGELQLGVPEVGYYRIRPPIKPVTLQELAAMETMAADT